MRRETQIVLAGSGRRRLSGQPFPGLYRADHVTHEHGEALPGVVALPATAAIKLGKIRQPALGESEPFA
jgi:hypothetical protein